MIRRRRRTAMLIASLMTVLTLLTPSTVQADTRDPATGKQLNYVAHCVNAVNDISKNGFGATKSSCMGCDPTLPTCYFNCQPLVKKLYEWCDNVCLPDGFYFDPKKTMKGCWKEHAQSLKISVERCGCSSAHPTLHLQYHHFVVVLVSIVAVVTSVITSS